MKNDISNEQLFIADIEALDLIAQDLRPVLADLESWRVRCQSALDANRLRWPGLQSHHPLAVQADTLNAAIDAGADAWDRQWLRMAPARALAESLDGMLVLLVFGKFNAGKSSFCNLLAERFAAAGKRVEYFYLEDGALIEGQASFNEGVTETTSRMQGVRLAERLVLVDTPGLHSVKPENAALTQLFTDSADAVLWLTSSTSPGQVQELDELGRELHRNKPLLPVLTRSDVYEEDEIDGEIVKVLRGKRAANRAMQEADVALRARKKLENLGVDNSLLRLPVSISSLLARQQQPTGMALAESGFAQLYASLRAMLGPALVYQRRKQAEMVLHYLEESVLGTLRHDLMPRIADLRAGASAALKALPQQQQQLEGALWRAVAPQLPQLCDRYAVSGDRAALDGGVLLAVCTAYLQQIDQQWGSYQLAYGTPVHGGMDARQANHSSGSEAVIDYQALYASARSALRAQLLSLGDDTAAQVREAIGQLRQLTGALGEVIVGYAIELHAIKSSLQR